MPRESGTYFGGGLCGPLYHLAFCFDKVVMIGLKDALLEIAESVNCLLYKHEDLSSKSRTHMKQFKCSSVHYNSSTEEAKAGESS